MKIIFQSCKKRFVFEHFNGVMPLSDAHLAGIILQGEFLHHGHADRWDERDREGRDDGERNGDATDFFCKQRSEKQSRDDGDESRLAFGKDDGEGGSGRC